MRMRGFVGPAYQLSTVTLDCQRSVNLYVEPDELMTGKDQSVGALVSRPGLTRLATLPVQPIRGLYVAAANGTLYVVARNKLYSVSSSWAFTELGTLQTTTGTVSMADNGQQLIIVDGLSGYILTLANSAFSTINSGAFYSSNRVVFIDGFFALVKPNSQIFYLSGLYDGTSYNGLDFASAEGSPDTLVTLIPYRNQLFLLGSQTAEIWYNSGDVNFPYTRVLGGLIEHGCAAPLSVAKTGEDLFWLGQDEYGNGVVWQARGYNIARASNYGVELAMQSYGNISDAVAFVYQQRGHTFYCLNFTGANTTWVLDTSLGVWHERTSQDGNGNEGRWRANTHAFAYGVHVVGDFQDGRIYSLDTGSFTDDGLVMTRMRRAPHSSNNLDRMVHSKFQLDFRAGVGTDGTALGQQPTAMLRWSDDGGFTWSSERFGTMGRLGQTKARAIWRRLGQSRDRVYEVKITDPVDVAIIGADLDVIPAAS